MVLNSANCRSSVTTSPEPLTVSLLHPFRSTTIQPDAITAAKSEMLNNGINLIFITPSLLRTSFISVIQKLSRMLHPFGLMGTAIDEIYHVFSKGCAR
jgi:hypothetical protein